jgi:hypothetical protein
LNGVTRLEQGRSRVEREKSFDIWNFGSLIIAIAEIVKIYKCVKIKSTIFQAIGIDCLACTEAKQCCSNKSVT